MLRRAKLGALRGVRVAIRVIAWASVPLLAPLLAAHAWATRELARAHGRAVAVSAARRESSVDRRSATRNRRARRTRRVVIVGAGFAGRKVKLDLDARRIPGLEVIIVDQRDWFEYTPAILRVMAWGENHRTVVIPPGPGSTGFLHGKVTAIQPEGLIEFHSGHTEAFDALVLAPGSTYTKGKLPGSFSRVIKPGADIGALGKDSADMDFALDARAQTLRIAARELRRANSILIVGGGLVGVELAADLAECFEQNPRPIVLIHSGRELCESLPKKARDYIKNALVALGVVIHTQVSDLTLGENRCTFLTATGSDRALDYDLCVECTGVKPSTDILAETMPEVLTSSGYIRVDRYLQVTGSLPDSEFANIFALGDAAEHAASRDKAGNILYADLQAEVVANNVLARLGVGRMLAFQGTPAAAHGSLPMSLCASLGKVDGSYVLNSFVINGYLAALLKVIVEETKILQMRGNPFGIVFWSVCDFCMTVIQRFLDQTFPTAPNVHDSSRPAQELGGQTLG